MACKCEVVFLFNGRWLDEMMAFANDIFRLLVDNEERSDEIHQRFDGSCVIRFGTAARGYDP